MSSGFTAGVLTLFFPIFLFAASCANDGDDKTDTGTQKHYSSPTAVFDVYREFLRKREWRNCFSLLTPEAQNETIFEQFFECAMANSKESSAIVKKFVDGAAVKDDYEKQYKKKYGIDIAKVSAGHENDPTFVPPAQDRDLQRDVLAAHVKDKAGFSEAVGNLFVTNPVTPLGDLEQVVVHDDTATGRVETPGFHYETLPGKSPRKVEDKIYKPFKFRRINGGWLLDSL